MIILTNNKLIDEKGKCLFRVETAADMARLRAVDADDFITDSTPEEAQACLQDLAQRLYAHRWDPSARCFVPVSYEPNDVRRVIQYMSHDNFPPEYVKGILDIVSAMNWTRESEQDVWAMIKTIRAKNYSFDSEANISEEQS